MKETRHRGFALITVLGVVLIVSAVALTLASTMRVEALQVLGDRTSVELDELSRSGQEMALYLASRSLGASSENLEGLPVEAIQPGFHYVVHFPNTDVHLYLDAEDGKLNLSAAPPALLEGFLALWANDAERGRALSAAVEDWRDPDSDIRPGGAEAGAYEARGYAPRNRALGMGDVGLLQGFEPEDFRDRLIGRNEEWRPQPSLTGFLTNAPTGGTINPNFASEFLLRSVPGLTPAQADRVLAERSQGLFKDLTDFSARVGVAPVAPVARLLHFTRRVPAVLTIARGRDGRGFHSERRVLQPYAVEFNVFPDYARVPS